MEDVDEDWIFTWIHTCMCSCTHVCQHACKNPGIHIFMQNKWTVLFINVSFILLEFLFKNYLFCFTCMVFYLHPYLCTMYVRCLWRSEEGTESYRTGVRSNCDPPCIEKWTWVFRKNSQCSSLMGHFCSSRLAFSCWCVGLCSLCLSGLAVLLFFSLVPWNAKHEGHLARQSLLITSRTVSQINFLPKLPISGTLFFQTKVLLLNLSSYPTQCSGVGPSFAGSSQIERN